MKCDPRISVLRWPCVSPSELPRNAATRFRASRPWLVPRIRRACRQHVCERNDSQWRGNWRVESNVFVVCFYFQNLAHFSFLFKTRSTCTFGQNVAAERTNGELKGVLLLLWRSAWRRGIGGRPVHANRGVKPTHVTFAMQSEQPASVRTTPPSWPICALFILCSAMEQND